MKKRLKNLINITIWFVSAMAGILGYAILIGDTIFGINKPLGLSLAITGTLIYLLYFVVNRPLLEGGLHDCK